MLLKEKEIKFSDYDLLEELGCKASLPNDAPKLELFLNYAGLASLPKDGKFVSSPTQFNVKQIEASAKHFYNLENMKQVDHFADFFFEVVEFVFENQSRDYAQNFFTYLCPTFLRREKDLERYKKLFEKHKNSENTNFVNLLSNEIDLFVQIMQ